MRRLLLCLCLVPVAAFGQSFTASVRGTVTDSTKAAIPSAAIVLTEIDRGVKHSATTDSEGRYVVTALPPGKYNLTAEAPGFRKFTQPAFALEVQQSATINVELGIGEVATSVDVEATAPLLNTTIATLGQVMETQAILSAPLANRSVLALTMLAPGIVPVTPGGVSNTNFVANGTRNSSAEVLMDGINISGIEQNGGVTDVKYQPSPDVIQEFKVQTNFFSAEFGNTGGAIINMVSKSGTNAVHGVVYDFHRNNALNANSWFSNRNGQSLPESKRNIFGGTMGGPVVIPKLYSGKNRTFFFANYEGERNNGATTTTGTVPTARQLGGDFSDTRLANGNLVPIYNPFDAYTSANGATLRRPFQGNIVPLSAQSRIARKAIEYFPKPTSEGNPFTRVNNFFNQGTNQSENNKIDAKVDHNISEKQRFSTRYSLNWGNSQPANLTGNISDNSNPSENSAHNLVFDYTRTHSPSTIVTARVGILRVLYDRLPQSTGFDQTTLGLSPLFLTAGVKMFPSFSPGGYRAIGVGGYAIINRREDLGTASGGVTKIAGSHTFKMGGEFRALRENYFQPDLPQGGFSFDRAQTGENPLVSSASQGDGLASMLVGWGSSGTLSIDYPTATASQYFGIYTQDDWRVTSKLTINLGLRYDFDVPRTERFNRMNWFDLYAPSPIAGKAPQFPNLIGAMRFATDDRRSPFDGDYNNIQPRVGFAYALGARTSLRAGYGLFYTAGRHTIKGEVGSAFRSGSSVQFSRDSNITQFASLENPFPVGLTLPFGRDPLAFMGLGFSSNISESKNQQYQQWNFSVQREVPGSGVVEVNYAGSKGTHLYMGTGDIMGNRNKLDPVYYGLGRTVLNQQVGNPFYGVITDPRSVLSAPTVQYHRLLRTYPQYAGGVGGYMAIPNIGNSTYHSVQFKYEKRFSQGLSLLAHYTISKMLTDSDSAGSDVEWLGGGSTLQSWKDLRLEKSLAVFDIPQRVVTSFDYQFPFGRGRAFGNDMNKIVNGFLGGWEISGILTFSKGFPIAPTLAAGTLWDANQRPNLTGDPRMDGSAFERMNGYFNSAAFSRPAADTLGTAPRTLNYRAPGITNGDLTLMKNFSVTEHKSFQLRLESYNFTNSPTFGAPNSQFGNNSFGIISGYAGGRGARQVQVAVKFYY